MSLAARFVTIGASATSVAVAYVFFANGFLFANWVVRIPSVKDTLGLNDAQLGLALVAMAVGGITGMQLGGALSSRFGSAPVATVSGIWFCLVFALVGLAPSLVFLAGALFLAGLGNGAMDVSMNAQAASAERAAGVRILSFCHAMFSAGLALGALPAGLLAALGLDVATHLILVGAPLAAGILFAARFATPDRNGEVADGPLFALPKGPLLLFGVICFCGAIVEGAMNDWVAVYMEDTLGRGPIAAAAAFGAFATAMFLARLFGDVATERTSSTTIVRFGLLIAAAGLVLALTGVLGLVLVGFAAVGLGIAGVFPAVFRAAGNLPGRAPGPSMAAAVTLGYAGFLFGPAVIGFVAEATSLQIALGLMIPLCLIGAIFASALRAAD